MICSPKLNRQLRYSAAVAVLGAVVAGVALFLISFIFAIAQTNDVYPPVISGVMADNITAFSAQIKWGTDEPSDSRVAYGTASGQYPYGSDNRCDGGGMVTQHCVYLGGLQSGTVYYYRVMSMDGSLNEAVSPGHQFTTVSESSGGTNIPAAPSNLRLDPPSSTSAIYLKWTDNADNEDKFNVQRALAGSGSWSFSIQLEGSNLIAYSDSSVVSGTLYDYRVQACRSGYGCSAYAYLYNVKTASDTSVQIAHATAKGTVLDSNNLAIAGAVVHIFSKDTGVSVSQTTLSDGTFNFSVPAGNYTAEFFPPHNRTDLAKPSPISFSVQSGETKSLTVKFSVPTKVISGRAQFSNGIAVTDANISVYNSVSGQSMRIKTDSNGNYQFKAGPGKWIVNILPVEPSAAKWRAEGFGQEAIFSEDATAENRILNFPVSSALSKVMVTTVDQNNAPVSDAGVVLDAAGVIQTSVTQNIFREWRKSDGSGLAHFFAPQGVYFIRAFLPSESGFINPEEQKIEIGSAQDKSVKIVFRKKETITTVEITGKVKLDDDRPVDAVVWGWSQKGLSVETRANSSGEFRFTIPPNDRWSFGAGKEVGGFPYKSNQIIIDVFNAPVAIHLVLKRFGETALAPSVSVEQSATQKIIAQTQDGAKVTVPPSATAQTGNVSVDIKPTIEAPSQAASKVVSTVYEITVRDQVGQQIKQLQEEIEIVLPYDLNQLKAQGVTEDTIVPSFFDETTGTWVKLDNFIVDKEKKVIVAKVKHLTRFAIVAAADVVPPSPPTNVVAANLSGGSVRLSWLNPIADFHHAKIYRSTVQGELGSVIYHEVIGNSAVDGKGLVNGVAYYYLIRAVDSAGNESTNTTQITVVAVGTSSAVGTFAKNLRFGDKNDDVKALQEFLITEGVYPEALVTGYFGLLTRAAAIKFQEKYRADILTPLGLTDGTGFVGPSTRVKINAILSN